MDPNLTSNTTSGLRLISALTSSLVSVFFVCYLLGFLISWKQTRKPVAQEMRRSLRLLSEFPSLFWIFLPLIETRSIPGWNLFELVSSSDAAWSCLRKPPSARPVVFLATCPGIQWILSIVGCHICSSNSQLEGVCKHRYYARFNIAVVIRGSLPWLGLGFESVEQIF